MNVSSTAPRISCSCGCQPSKAAIASAGSPGSVQDSRVQLSCSTMATKLTRRPSWTKYGVDAVGPDQEVDLDGRAVGEARLHALAVIVQPHEQVPDVKALGRQRAGERAQQVGAVHLVVREAEGLDDGLAQIGAQQGAPVVPAALVPGQRADAHPGQVVGQAQAVQDARALGLTWMPAPTSLTAAARS